MALLVELGMQETIAWDEIASCNDEHAGRILAEAPKDRKEYRKVRARTKQ